MDSSLVDETELSNLMEMCKAEYPDIDHYIIWVYSVEFLMEKAGHTIPKTEAEEMYKKAKEQLNIEQYFVNVECE